jgi:DNA-binding MarR family transcriptional regulator
MLSKKILESIPNAIRTMRRISAGVLDRDMTFQQFRILTLVHEGMGQTQMSQTLQVSMAAISKIVDSLVKKKLLSREQEADRRCLKLKLTTDGEKIRKLIQGEVAREFDVNLKKLTKKELLELQKGLEVLDKLMGFVNEE